MTTQHTPMPTYYIQGTPNKSSNFGHFHQTVFANIQQPGGFGPVSIAKVYADERETVQERAAFIVRACNAQADVADVIEALAGIIADYEATIEVAKQGKVAEISLGQFRRLSLAKARLAKAEGK